MEGQAMNKADAGQASAAPDSGRLRSMVVVLTLGALLALAWYVRHNRPYSPASDFGYALGVTGGCLLLALLLYPIRKRVRWLAVAGPLKHWFRFHMIGGVFGPFVVLFHSGFRVSSFNAAIALSCMLLVVASGLIGRFLYRRIHHGLYGSRATLDELRRTVEAQIAALRPQLVGMPTVAGELDHFAATLAHEPQNMLGRVMRILSMDWQRFVVAHRIHRAIDACDSGEAAAATRANLHALSHTIDDALTTLQRTAQFSTYERLFSLWHVVHIPFLCMLLITGIAHVVAVHAY
jgi:hypothetical protein